MPTLLLRQAVGRFDLYRSIVLSAIAILTAAWLAPGAQAQGPDGFSVYYVTPDGTGGGGDGPTTDTLQKAIDIVDDDGDVIKVQAGTYLDTTEGGGEYHCAQVSRTMTILGGYAPGGWSMAHPGAYPTTLDPAGQGVAVWAQGGHLTMTGFHLVNGKGATVSAKGGDLTLSHCTVSGTQKGTTASGAVQSSYRTVVLTSCTISNNGSSSPSISDVSGVYCYYGNATITSCTIVDNSNFGIMLNTAHNSRIAGCTIRYNEYSGIRFDYGDNCVVTSNTIENNHGAGVHANKANGLQVTDNSIVLHTEWGTYFKDSNGALAEGNTYSYNGFNASDGGAIYVDSADDVAIRNNAFVRNDAGLTGGAVSIERFSKRFTIAGNWFIGNDAAVSGGGLYVDDADGVIRGNWFCGNESEQEAGGLCVDGDESILVTGNVFFQNTADDSGGGMLVANKNAILTSNTIVSNTGTWGGGASLSGSRMWVEGNFFHDNKATFKGGGLLVGGGDMLLLNNTVWRNRCWLQSGTPAVGAGVSMSHSQATLVNNVIAGNRHGAGENWTGTGGGSGIYMERSAPQIYFNTVVSNFGGDGSGIYACEKLDEISTVTMQGNIVTSHTIGVRVRDTSIANLDYTLWGGGEWVNATNHEVVTSGTIADLNPLSGDPLFAEPEVCDYHIASGSGGENAVAMLALASLWSSPSLNFDCDAQARPYGAGADAGVDEIGASALPEVNLASSATTQSESVGTYMLPVALSAASAQPVYVNYMVEAATPDLSFEDDTWTFPGLLTFPPTSTTAYIPIRVLDDNDGEGPEHFTVSLVHPRNARIGSARRFVFTIEESDDGISLWTNTIKNHLTEFARLRYNEFIYADVNGDGRVDAADRTWRLLEILSESSPGQGRNGAAATVTVGSASGAPGDIVEIPIVLSADADMAGAHVRLTYDPTVLEWDTGITSFVERGPLMTDDHSWDLHAPSEGKVNFWVGDNGSSAPPFAAQSGTLFTIRMRIASGAPAGVSPVAIRPDATPNPGWPVDSCAGVSDPTGYSMALTRVDGSVTVAGDAPVRFDTAQSVYCESTGTFYAVAWNYETQEWEGAITTSGSGTVGYTLNKTQWVGVFLYDLSSFAYVEGAYVYRSDL